MKPPQPPAPRAMPGVEATRPSPGKPAGTGLPSATRWHSQDLLGSAAEVEIAHGGQVYRLRRTALGKLILTK